ncbi:MAG: hypothetical protein R2860_06775 [Desulfobacterales bacterium]
MKFKDPVLTFQLSNDFHIKKVAVGNYMPEDTQSDAYGVLMEWNNIYYENASDCSGAVKSYPALLWSSGRCGHSTRWMNFSIRRNFSCGCRGRLQFRPGAVS